MHHHLNRAINLCYLIVFAVIFGYASRYVSSTQGWLYLVPAAVVQSCLLLLPSYLLYVLATRLASRLIVCLFHVLALTSLVVIVANYKLHAMYNFFVDGFVINLLTTPGGVEALGLSPSFYFSCAVLMTASIVVYAAAVRFVPLERLTRKLPAARVLASILVMMAVAEAALYSYASYTSNSQILAIADRVVWHIPVSARGFYRQLGVELAERQLAHQPVTHSGDLVYPTSDILPGAAKKPYNIIWLTAESLRADMLTPEIMPNTYAFAQANSRFMSHYSGGNGTRLGMFSQFYGLYGSYWFDVLERRNSPILINKLIDSGYDITAITSARFTYPEFDKTIFSRVPKNHLIEYHDGKGWERDEKNTSRLIRHIKQQANSNSPFFAFMFFESSHANYYFPRSHVIRKDYLDDFDYLSVDIADNVSLIKNRYINATHYLDSRLGLVFDALRESGLENNTIVIVTGDHGEEFMEKGRWGHNSTFVQEQIRVPLVIHMPNQTPRVVNNMTSHLDIPATILQALGYTENPALYSFGHNLFSDDFHRHYTVASDWHGDTLITPSVKFVLSLKSSGNHSGLTTIDDIPIEGKDLTVRDKDQLADFIGELPRFYLDSPAFQQNQRLAKRETHPRLPPQSSFKPKSSPPFTGSEASL